MARRLLSVCRMELKVTKRTHGQRVVVQIHGRLAGSGVAEVERVCRTTGRPFALDLENLHSADARGIELIRTLAGQGLELIGASPYFQLLLTARGGE